MGDIVVENIENHCQEGGGFLYADPNHCYQEIKLGVSMLRYRSLLSARILQIAVYLMSNHC